MDIVKKEKQLAWEPHPYLPIQIKPFLSKKADGADITIFLVKLPVGKEIPEHVHETQEDIIFIVAGKAKMWIDGIGDFILERRDLCPGPEKYPPPHVRRDRGDPELRRLHTTALLKIVPLGLFEESWGARSK